MDSTRSLFLSLTIWTPKTFLLILSKNEGICRYSKPKPLKFANYWVTYKDSIWQCVLRRPVIQSAFLVMQSSPFTKSGFFGSPHLILHFIVSGLCAISPRQVISMKWHKYQCHFEYVTSSSWRCCRNNSNNKYKAGKSYKEITYHFIFIVVVRNSRHYHCLMLISQVRGGGSCRNKR